MSGNNKTDRICALVTILSIVITLLFMNGEALGLEKRIDADSDTGEDTVLFTDNDLTIGHSDADAVSSASTREELDAKTVIIE